MFASSRKNNPGFTLLEMAIVMVIIGLLLGGVIKGAAMIENARVKKSATAMNAIGAAYRDYIELYRFRPGDDGGTLSNLTGRGGLWTQVTEFGNRNGVLNVGRSETFSGAAENDAFWQHLKAGNFLKGDPSISGRAALINGPFAPGRFGITSDLINGGLRGVKVCLSNVPGDAARALDTMLDDGNGRNGNFRASLSQPNTRDRVQFPTFARIAAPYATNSYYTVCQVI